MKLLTVVLIAASALAEDIKLNYHESVGIKEAARIKQAEEALDFDGSRITGGWVVGLGTHPHLGGLLITLTNGQTSVCASSLISNTRAVTAANCWWDGNSQASQFTVVLGSLTLFTGGTRIVSNSVVTHGSYNPSNLNNNIAMITLNSVAFNDYIQPVLLPTPNFDENLAGETAWVAGFGRTGDDAPITDNQILRHARLTIITNAACAQVYGSIIQASTICTYGVSDLGLAGICGGDAGGGLWAWGGSRRYLIGISSFGHSSGCQRGQPSGYVRVTSYLAWIQARL